MLHRFGHVWFCVTLWTGTHQAPLSVGFSRQEYWRGSTCLPPGDLPDPGIEPKSPAWPVGSLLLAPPGKPLVRYKYYFFFLCSQYIVSLPLTWKVFVGKSDDSLRGIPFCIARCFYLTAFRIPLLSLILVSLIIVCLCVDLFGFILLGTLSGPWT